MAEDGEDEDVLLERMAEPSALSASGSDLPEGVDLDSWNQEDHLETENGSQVVPWEHVGRFPTKDLESLWTPARAYHKKLFQISMDDLIGISYPVYVAENGLWRQKKKKTAQQPKSRPSTTSKGGAGASGTAEPGGDVTANDEDGAAEGAPTETRDGADEAAASTPVDGPDEEKKSGMTMFNLVFILNPKKHESKELVETVYFHIIRKVNKAYKYAQQRSDFVWKESKRILALKDKGREDRTRMSVLWRSILESSSLASSMQEVYEAVCANRIAALQLETPEGAVTHSVQIPVPFYLTDLPSTDSADHEDDRFKGLWITTANSFGDVLESGGHDDPALLDKTFALLLLHDEKKIINELQADPDDTTAAMVEFVRLSKPTTSFHAIGAGTVLSPAQVRRYAQHFIFWRRAIAIPPLHARDVYILSPNCNTEGLPQASQAWQRAFPLAPPLPNFLADLSTAPRPYKWFAPSKNHRPIYLQMLAWLMRGGWVTQLCTFAYVVVWPEIQYEVEYRLEADEIKAATLAAAGPGDEGHGEHGGTATAETAAGTTETAAPGGLAAAAAAPASPHALSPHTAGSPPPEAPSSSSAPSSPSPGTSPLPEAAAASASTTANEAVAEAARLTRLADRASRALAERAAAHGRKPVPQATDHPSLNAAPHLAHLAPYLVLDAKKATGKDSLYLSAIGRRFRDPRVRASWPVFWKYLNGRCALERVALLEDMKRKEAWAILGGMAEYLICVRHW